MKPVTPELANGKLETGTEETINDLDSQAIINIQTGSTMAEGSLNLAARM